MPDVAPALTIRTATLADLVNIARRQRSWSDAVGFLPTPALTSAIAESRVLVATTPTGPIAHVIYRRNSTGPRNWLTIIALAVDRPNHRAGIATTLAATLIDDAIRTAVTTIVLHCRDDLPARYFWPRLGFRPIAHQPAGTRRGGTRVTWALALSPITPADVLLGKPARITGKGGRFCKRRPARTAC